MRVTVIALALVCGIVGPAALAEEPTPRCAATVAPKDELAPWVNPAPFPVEISGAQPAERYLRAGQAVTLRLHPADHLSLPVEPKKPGGSGGLVALSIVETGTYRMALSSAAWIDVIQEGRVLESVSHGHGPDCSGIRKIVDFALSPGRYTIQLTGNAESTTRLLVAKKP